jgi:hypothetical protein
MKITKKIHPSYSMSQTQANCYIKTIPNSNGNLGIDQISSILDLFYIFLVKFFFPFVIKFINFHSKLSEKSFYSINLREDCLVNLNAKLIKQSIKIYYFNKYQSCLTKITSA